MGDIFISSLGKDSDGFEMAVINVHPGPTEMAGEHGPGEQKAKRRKGVMEEIMKVGGFLTPTRGKKATVRSRTGPEK